MVYVLLLLAVAAEVVGTSMLVKTDGFTRLSWTAATLGSYAVAFLLLAQVVKELPVGVTYAIWSGLGTCAIALIGVVVLNQAMSTTTALGVALIVAGVVVVNLSVAH